MYENKNNLLRCFIFHFLSEKTAHSINSTKKNHFNKKILNLIREYLKNKLPTQKKLFLVPSSLGGLGSVVKFYY